MGDGVADGELACPSTVSPGVPTVAEADGSGEGEVAAEVSVPGS